MNVRLELREQQAKAKKLNVVEKSRMDWAGFVDKEGIKDELELAGMNVDAIEALGVAAKKAHVAPAVMKAIIEKFNAAKDAPESDL